MALEIPVFSSVIDVELDTGFLICFLGALVVHVVTEIVAGAVAGGVEIALCWSLGRLKAWLAAA